MKELSLHLLDIIRNSIAAEADLIELTIEEQPADNYLTLQLSDDGSGISEEKQKEVINPFVTSRKTREVGLGLPFLKAAAEQAGGDFKLESELQVGTTITASFEYDHLDRAPLGDIVSTLVTVLNSEPELELVYTHQFEGEMFQFDTREIKEELGEVQISNPQILNWLRDYLEENIEDLRR